MAKPTNELTPMQRQYNDIKERNQDCILFFRLGWLCHRRIGWQPRTENLHRNQW